MKKVRLILSAAMVFAIVGTALAFKPFGAGHVRCFSTSNLPDVTKGCTATGQPASTLIDFDIVTSGGTTGDPCASGTKAFDASQGNACPSTNGQTQYVSTDPGK